MHELQKENAEDTETYEKPKRLRFGNLAKLMSFNFTLVYGLPNDKPSPLDHLEALHEAGCDDALPGTGEKGFILLDFTREALDEAEALLSARADVETAIPGARLIHEHFATCLHKNERFATFMKGMRLR